MGTTRVRFLLLCAAVMVASVAASAQNRTRSVVTTGGSAPSGGTFRLSIDRLAQKGLPTIAGNTIVFGSDVDLNGQTVYGIYAEVNGVLRVIARTGSAAPSGGTYQDITHYAVDRSGNVFFLARTGDGTTPDVAVKYSFPVFTTLAKVGDALPGGAHVTSVGTAIAPDGSGGAYFQVGTSATAGGIDAALVHAKGDFLGTKTLVAATGAAAPGGGTYSSISSSTIASNTSGIVAFTATVTGGTSGIFSGFEGNVTLAEPNASDATPNLTVADNDDAEISYQQPSSPDIKTTTLTGTQVLVANNSPAPRTKGGRINFGAFHVAMAADVEGSLYFFAPVAGDQNENPAGAGLFRRDRFTGTVTAVALQGDPAAGNVSGVFGIFALAGPTPTRVANDDGKVVFAATSGAQSGSVTIFTTLGVPDGLVPSIASVQVKGNKLFVVGGGFEPGAKILVNNAEVSDTKNNKLAPSTKLQSKTGGSRIPSGTSVTITVRNPTGAVSASFPFTKP